VKAKQNGEYIAGRDENGEYVVLCYYCIFLKKKSIRNIPCTKIKYPQEAEKIQNK
jgi:hypothetical protein